MTLTTDISTAAPAVVNCIPRYTIQDVFTSCYGGATQQPEGSWLTGEVALVDPVTGWEYCPVFFDGKETETAA